jgi:hypothetical protein
MFFVAPPEKLLAGILQNLEIGGCFPPFPPVQNVLAERLQSSPGPEGKPNSPGAVGFVRLAAEDSGR